jgi:cadmium resistance protein CadD (predicted permease)
LALPSHILTVAAVTIANGGDNIGTYIPLFATMSAPERGMIVALFLVLTVLWFAGASLLVRHRRARASIWRYGQRSLPWVLIGLGFYIMGRTHLLALL